jgi:hypothetical protein
VKVIAKVNKILWLQDNKSYPEVPKASEQLFNGVQ